MKEKVVDLTEDEESYLLKKVDARNWEGDRPIPARLLENQILEIGEYVHKTAFVTDMWFYATRVNKKYDGSDH